MAKNCACYVDEHPLLDNDIVLCPTHAQAPALLTALKAARLALTDAAAAILATADYMPSASADIANGEAYREASDAAKAARQAITAAAKGS